MLDLFEAPVRPWILVQLESTFQNTAVSNLGSILIESASVSDDKCPHVWIRFGGRGVCLRESEFKAIRIEEIKFVSDQSSIDEGYPIPSIPNPSEGWWYVGFGKERIRIHDWYLVNYDQRVIYQGPEGQLLSFDTFTDVTVETLENTTKEI